MLMMMNDDARKIFEKGYFFFFLDSEHFVERVRRDSAVSFSLVFSTICFLSSSTIIRPNTLPPFPPMSGLEGVVFTETESRSSDLEKEQQKGLQRDSSAEKMRLQLDDKQVVEVTLQAMKEIEMEADRLGSVDAVPSVARAAAVKERQEEEEEVVERKRLQKHKSMMMTCSPFVCDLYRIQTISTKS